MKFFFSSKSKETSRIPTILSRADDISAIEKRITIAGLIFECEIVCISFHENPNTPAQSININYFIERESLHPTTCWSTIYLLPCHNIALHITCHKYQQTTTSTTLLDKKKCLYASISRSIIWLCVMREKQSDMALHVIGSVSRVWWYFSFPVGNVWKKICVWILYVPTDYVLRIAVFSLMEWVWVDYYWKNRHLLQKPIIAKRLQFTLSFHKWLLIYCIPLCFHTTLSFCAIIALYIVYSVVVHSSAFRYSHLYIVFIRGRCLHIVCTMV